MATWDGDISISVSFPSIEAGPGENESCFKERIPRVINGGERSGVNTVQ